MEITEEFKKAVLAREAERLRLEQLDAEEFEKKKAASKDGIVHGTSAIRSAPLPFYTTPNEVTGLTPAETIKTLQSFQPPKEHKKLEAAAKKGDAKAIELLLKEEELYYRAARRLPGPKK